jgi:uncharacterized protein YjbI with pentapeptide repeats
MDQQSFDRLARAMGSIGSRRAALGALLGAGLAGTIAGTEAAKKDRNKNRRNGKKGRGKSQVSAQAADCLSPGPSSNMNGCNFEGENFSGQDLSSSSMVGTIFRNAELVGTDLSSSNMRGANFRGADLECADLSSSVLRNADFRGFAPFGRPTNLTGADLHSSGGCGTILTNQFTIICGTIWCDGSVRNDDCPGGPPAGACTPYSPGTCGPGEDTCKVPGTLTCNGSQDCACGTTKVTQSTFCFGAGGRCHACSGDADCASFGADWVCLDFSTGDCANQCPSDTVCAPPCPSQPAAAARRAEASNNLVNPAP